MSDNLLIALNQDKRVLGRQFGRLTVLSPTEHRANNGSILFLADCECGNNTLVRNSDLTSGATRSCGCLKKETSIANGQKRFQDLSGSKIGRLRILFREGSNDRNQPMYVCWCECGNVTRVAADHLRRKRPVKSCGCSKVQENLVGRTFHYLEVLEKVRNPKRKGWIWKCQCQCGNETLVEGYLLKNGKTKSCGCYGQEITRQRNVARLIDLTGQKFGKLTVLRRDGTYGKGRVSKPTWLCQCQCGNQLSVTGNRLTMKKKSDCGCSK